MAALLKELEMKKNYLDGDPVETIYLGGGTPSLLTKEELVAVFEKTRSVFDVQAEAEITLESNPDDITGNQLADWKEIGINRLSIGIQSFFEEDLKWMNRAHNAQQAIVCLQLAKSKFANITIDLIYGFPPLTNEKWKQNVDMAISLQIPHLSCYALTVEPKTPLDKMIRQQQAENPNPGKQSEQFLLLMQWMEEAGYEHYEISNFAKMTGPTEGYGWRSRHNSSYWSTGPGLQDAAPGKIKKYLGFGPSAHSYNGSERAWNISNNTIYIDSINRGVLPMEKEVLTPVQKLNEYIMTSLRTSEGLNLDFIAATSALQIRTASRKFIESGLLKYESNSLVLTKEGKLLADGIAADLFF